MQCFICGNPCSPVDMVAIMCPNECHGNDMVLDSCSDCLECDGSGTVMICDECYDEALGDFQDDIYFL